MRLETDVKWKSSPVVFIYLLLLVLMSDVRGAGWWVARQGSATRLGWPAQHRNEVDVTLNSVKTSQELGELSL